MRSVGCCLTVIAVNACLAAEPLSKTDAQRFERHLVPLPRQMQMNTAVTVAAAGVAIHAPTVADPLVGQAVKELREALGPAKLAAKGSFTIRIEVGGPAAERLAKLPNFDQAYTIEPLAGGDGLRLVGSGVRGAYYAAKTLQQLITAGRQGQQVRIPLVTITDWPDLQDRGLWGGDSYEHIRWMSDRKMNIDEQIAVNGIRDGKPYVGLGAGKRQMIEEGPTYGVNPVPVVLHLEQLSGSGLFEAHPELKGVNGRPGSICYSNPLFSQVLAQWLLGWRAMPGVREVDVWMAENLQQEKGCQCESCAKEDRSVLEARAIVAGWKLALKTQPDLGLRVLTSEETEKANPQVFAELPKEVKIWYYHSLFTYNTAEKPMLRPYLAETAASGRYVGVCPNLCAIVGTFQPFTGPQFIRYRMNEFVDKKMSGLIGYAVPGIPHCRLNTEAAAEWSWNAKGRSPREFALSYAVRQGYDNPEKFADWCDIHGPVAWDVYGSEFPSGQQRGFPGPMAKLLREGKLPDLGYVLWEVYAVPWGDIKTLEQFEKDVQDADRSLALARELAMPELIAEAEVIHGYINALKALWELKPLVKDGKVAEADKPAARRWFKAYIDGLEQAAPALTRWEQSVKSPHRQMYSAGAVKVVTGMAEEMKALAAELGCL